MLAGVRVANLGVNVPPTVAAARLAELGASVTKVEPRSPIVGAVATQAAPDDADDSDSEPAPSKEVAELYKQIQDLRAKEMAQRATPN